MRHTFISWDCCYRNFFHLIGSLARQNYPKDQYELIFVEQRSRECSDKFNHELGLMSLHDTVQEFKDKINVRAVFLEMANDIPYHLAICNNEGIKEAKGKYISVMDGDLLVKPNFIRELDSSHDKKESVINLDRRYATMPAQAECSEWVKGIIDFDLCLDMCPDKGRDVPKEVTNKGPLISAPKNWWIEIGGYDEHRIWSTGVSRLGQDVTARLEIYSGSKSIALKNQFCVHPYHPAGFNRAEAVELQVLVSQQKLINWCRDNNEYKHINRSALTESIYIKNKRIIESNISGKGKRLYTTISMCYRGLKKIRFLFTR